MVNSTFNALNVSSRQDQQSGAYVPVRPDGDRGISPPSASTYFSQVQGWHAREHGIKLCGGLKLEKLPEMLKGLRRVMGDATPRIRRGVAPQALRKAMDMLLDPKKPEDANIRAALSTAFQGLLRSAEFTHVYGKAWKPEDQLTRVDIKFIDKSQMIIMMHPCKNMKILKGKTVPLVIGAGGEYIDAVAEVNNMLQVDPAREFAAKETPLFRDPATNRPIT